MLAGHARPALGRLFRGHGLAGGGGFDFFVDSVNGDDENDGRTAETAFQTLSAASAAMAAGKKLALLKGSTWREMFDIDEDNITLGVVGTGAIPVISAAAVITGTWTQPDAVTYPDVWSVGITRAITPTATDYLRMWADGAPLVYQSSLANLQANGGFYTTSRTTTSPTVSIKSATDPNSSGVVYEFNSRANGIRGHGQLLGASAGDNQTVTGPIEAFASGQNYGPIAGGPGALSKVIAVGGGLHHITSETLAVEDVFAFDVDEVMPAAPYPMAAYRALSTGFEPVWKRSFVICDVTTHKTNGSVAHYAHSSSPSASADSAVFEQCYAQNMNMAIFAAAESLTVRGLYSRNNTTSVSMGQPYVSIQHAVVNTTSMPSPIAAFNDAGPVNLGEWERVIENCAIYSGPGVGANSLAGLNGRNGALTIRNCIIFLDSAIPNSIIRRTGTGNFSLTVEYCVFVRLEASPTGIYRTIETTNNPDFSLSSDHNIWIGRTNVDNTVGGVNYNTLATWQAQGYDLNSVQYLYTAAQRATVLSTFFQGDPANGDFRLKAGLGTFGDGVSLNLAGPQEHWDWNARAVAAGAPSAWPTVPTSLADARTYIANPAAWDFYP